MSEQPPEPGTVPDTTLGVGGAAEPLPVDDADQDALTEINEEDE